MHSGRLTTKSFVLVAVVFKRNIYREILCRSGYYYLVWSIDGRVPCSLSIAIEGVDIGMRGVSMWGYRVSMMESLDVR